MIIGPNGGRVFEIQIGDAAPVRLERALSTVKPFPRMIRSRSQNLAGEHQVTTKSRRIEWMTADHPVTATDLATLMAAEAASGTDELVVLRVLDLDGNAPPEDVFIGLTPSNELPCHVFLDSDDMPQNADDAIDGEAVAFVDVTFIERAR